VDDLKGHVARVRYLCYLFWNSESYAMIYATTRDFPPIKRDKYCVNQYLNADPRTVSCEACTAKHSEVLCPKGGGTCSLKGNHYPHLCSACGQGFG
jgi:hypothetical protein